jgi:hypothetical protein
LFLLRAAGVAACLVAGAAADEKRASEKNENFDIHVCPLGWVVDADSSCDKSGCRGDLSG